MTDLVVKYGTRLKLTAYVFVGLHVPLVVAGLVWLAFGQFEPRTIMLSILLGTIVGLGISLYGIWTILRERSVDGRLPT